MIQINSYSSFLRGFFSSHKKLILAFILCAITNIHSAVASTLPERDVMGSPSPKRPHGYLAIPEHMQSFVQAINEEYFVFKAKHHGAATPTDFLQHKTTQLKTAALDDRKTIALTIQYILRGYVFPIAPALPSEEGAGHTTYALAAILASSVHGVDPRLIPDFSTAMSGDDCAYHRTLVHVAGQHGAPDSITPTSLENFVAALVIQEKDAIENISRDPTQLPTIHSGGTAPNKRNWFKDLSVAQQCACIVGGTIVVIIAWRSGLAIFKRSKY